jgi:hypothetical protein
MIGVDENHQVPVFAGEHRDDPITSVEGNIVHSVDSGQDKSIEMANSKVQMVVMDGIVMGPKHCALIAQMI